MKRATYHETAQVIPQRQGGDRRPGAIEAAAVSGLSVAVVVMLGWAALVLLRLVALDSWRYAAALAILTGAAPFALLSWGRARFLLGTLESDLYRVTGWRLDLDADGLTGQDEIDDTDSPPPALPTPTAPEREVIRVVPVHTSAQPDAVLRLPDGREIGAARMRDFVIGAGTIGLALTAWKGRGWTRPEWETARDLLALHGLASGRAEGKAGAILASPGQCMRAFGIQAAGSPALPTGQDQDGEN